MAEKVKLLFLVSAHENNDCVQDTIDNIRKFNPEQECHIVLNISRHFVDFDAPRFLPQPMTYVGRSLDQRSNYRYASQLESYIRAYTLGKQHVVDFDYVKIHHTSELFVKFGLYDYIKHYDYAYKLDSQEEPLPERYHPLITLDAFKTILQDYKNLGAYRYNLIEAAFYSRAVFDFVEINCYNHLGIGLTELNNYFNYTPIEEIVIPTLVAELARQTPLRRGRNCLRYASDVMTEQLEDHEFTIKHVPRSIDDPLRVQMRNL